MGMTTIPFRRGDCIRHCFSIFTVAAGFMECIKGELVYLFEGKCYCAHEDDCGTWKTNKQLNTSIIV